MISSQQVDFKHIIHPYSSPMAASNSLMIEATEGVELILPDKKTRLIDGMSAWWSAIHGYNHPKLITAIQQQTKRMPHVMFGGLTHSAACNLTELLIDITPKNLTKVFFADSGSVAVEVALKTALQYWQSQGQIKTKFLTVRNGYHGDTFGAMSVTDPDNSMHSHFKGFISENYFAPAPYLIHADQQTNQDIQALRSLLAEHANNIAAVIIEPMVQGAGGMRFYRSDYLVQLKQLCQEYDTLLIFDEIATGFGRTGRLFALEYPEVVPDILCVGKALTAGMMTLAACLLDEKVAQAIHQGKPGLLMHGPTYMANALACRVAIASIELLQSYDWQTAVSDIEQFLQQGLAELRQHSQVSDVRVLGAIGVVETKIAIDNNKIRSILLDNGVWLRPFGKLLYCMPPFICNQQHILSIVRAMRDICDYLQDSS